MTRNHQKTNEKYKNDPEFRKKFIEKQKKYISEKRAAEIMHQIFNILAYCHKRDILHTDLKLENIIFNSSKMIV